MVVYCKHIAHARMDARTRTHAHTREHAHPTPPTTIAVLCIGAPNQSVMIGRTAFHAGETMAGRWSIEINNMRATLY